MSVIKDRIIEFIKSENISKRGFAASIGKSNSYVNNIVSTISADVMQKIQSEYPNLNIHWLLTGEGKMKVDKVHKIPSEVQQEKTSTNNIPLDILAKSIETLSESEKTNTKNIQELIAQGREQTNNITKLVDLLCKSGIIPDILSDSEKRGQSSGNDTEDNTASIAGSADAG